MVLIPSEFLILNNKKQMKSSLFLIEILAYIDLNQCKINTLNYVE